MTAPLYERQRCPTLEIPRKALPQLHRVANEQGTVKNASFTKCELALGLSLALNVGLLVRLAFTLWGPGGW